MAGLKHPQITKICLLHTAIPPSYSKQILKQSLKKRGGVEQGGPEKLLPSSTGQLSQLIPTGSLLLSATLLQSEAVVLSVFGILEIKYQDLHLLQQTVSRQPNHFPWALLSF